jgi:hypothetical protein
MRSKIVIYIRVREVNFPTRQLSSFSHDGAAKWLINWDAGKYLLYDICIRLFG